MNFWKTFAATLKTRGPAKTLAGLALASGGVLLAALVRAGKRAVDFRQPALPGCDPAPGQDLPALPPPGVPDPKLRKIVRKAPSPFVRSLDAALRTSSDWTRSPHPIWMWLSGGGLKGVLGARRFWAGLVRHVFDGFGRVGWTFMTIVVVPLEFATRRAAQMSTAFSDFRRMRDAGLLHLPLPTVRRRIFVNGVIPPMAAGTALLVEMLVLDHFFGIPTPLYLIDTFVSLGAIAVPILVYQWCQEDLPLHLAGQKWPLQIEIETIRNSSPRGSRTATFSVAALTLPSLGQAAPGSIGSCLLYSLFGPPAGQNTCAQSPLGTTIQNSSVLAAIPATLATVGTLVSSLAIFLLTLVYTYYIVQAMHTAAHTGDWTHEGVNAAWAPVRGATAAAMTAAPGGISVLASIILFVASTGNGLGDTAAAKASNMLTTPTPAAVVPPGVQPVVVDALYSLVCEHVLDNDVNPDGTVTAVAPIVDSVGRLAFSNVVGVGNYGPAVCGSYIMPANTAGAGMEGNTSFQNLVQAGGPLDQIASAIARNVNGCGSVVLGTGLSPCAPAGTPPNRAVFGQGGGLQNPAGSAGGLSIIVQNYVSSLGQLASTSLPRGQGNALQNIQNDGWLSLGGYYSFFARAARHAAATAEWLPVPTNGFGGADWSSIAGSSPQKEVVQAFRLTETYIEHYGFLGGPGPFWVAAPMPTTGPGASQAKIAALSTVTSPSGQMSVPAYMAANPGEDPLSRLQNVVESADVAVASADAAAAGLGNPTVRAGLALTGPVGATVAGAAGTAASAAKPILRPLTTALFVLSIAVVSYLPLLPALAFIFFGLFLVLEVAILALFAPLWALAAGIPQGDGFLGQHGREGMMRLADIALRPLLLTGMFVISLGLYFLGAALLLPATSAVVAGASSGSSPGIFLSAAGVIGGYLSYAFVLWRVMHFAFEILHTGPYWALKLLGVEGDASREGRHVEAGGREILSNLRTVAMGMRGDK